jgi:hypothetical protein
MCIFINKLLRQRPYTSSVGTDYKQFLSLNFPPDYEILSFIFLKITKFDDIFKGEYLVRLTFTPVICN